MSQLPKLDGSWEKPGKNPAVGAFIFILILGGLYFFLPSGLLNIIISIDMRVNQDAIQAEHFDILNWMARVNERYKVLLLSFTMVCQFLIFLGLAALLGRKWFSSRIINYARLDRVSLPGILVAVAGAVLLVPLVDGFMRLVYHFLPVFKELDQVMAPLIKAKSPAEVVFLFITIAITPALCEEFIFRGILQRTLQRRLRFPWHFLVSGLFFALFHQQTLSLPALFLVGVFLGYVYFAFDSLYVTIAAHFVYNGLLILLASVDGFLSPLLDNEGSFRLEVVAVCGALLVVLAVTVFFICRLHERRPEQIQVEAAEPT